MTREHWEAIYTNKSPDEVSWYQEDPVASVGLITSVALDTDASIVDVGGGASTLVDALLRRGFGRLTVCDIAETALQHARSRLGEAAAGVEWRRSDILAGDLPKDAFDIWHDRAVFHFLTAAADRKRYVEQVAAALRNGGHVILATFASDGPDRCSGLEVRRYSTAALAAELGSRFELLDSMMEEHVTPAGATQKFQYCVFRKATPGDAQSRP
jgi:SAM-dependent methyltransferase